MPFQSNYQGRPFVADTATFDVGLRRHMIAVYNIMMLGLVVSGLVAYEVGHNTALIQAIYGSGWRHIVPFVPFVFLLVLQMGIRNLSSIAAQAVFALFSASMGLSISWIFMEYSEQSITQIFFVTGAMFAGTSLYGYVTKANLAGIGSFLVMALMGIMVGIIVNIFMHSGMFAMLLNVATVLIFTGLTASQTQAIRNSYSESYGIESNRKLAVLGALSLYLSFMNLFLALLQLFGNRRQ